MKNTAVVLKEKHSLIGRGILPVVMKLKVGHPPPSPPIAKLIEHKLEELIQELKRLTGEELTNVLTLAGGGQQAQKTKSSLCTLQSFCRQVTNNFKECSRLNLKSL